MVAIIPGKAYVLTSVSSGHALDLSGGDKQSVLVFNKHGNGNQQWYFQERGGSVAIQCKYNCKYLAVTGGSGSPLQAHTTQSPAIFKIRAAANDTFQYVCSRSQSLGLRAHGGLTPGRILTKDTHYALDVQSGSLDSGVPVILYTSHGGNNQLWRATPAPNN